MLLTVRVGYSCRNNSLEMCQQTELIRLYLTLDEANLVFVSCGYAKFSCLMFDVGDEIILLGFYAMILAWYTAVNGHLMQ